MKRLTYLILPLLLISSSMFAQNIFPQLVEGCTLPRFCLDCGEPKANYDEDSFAENLTQLNLKYNFKGIKGQLQLQVLVDSLGKGCVISHTDKTNSKLSLEIISSLNRCKWVPAKEKDIPTNVSITILFEVVNDKLNGSIKRFNPGGEKLKFKSVSTPKIYNKGYVYNNALLNKYNIEVWTTENSIIPDDMGIYSAVDQNDNLWSATYGGIVKFDGKNFTLFNKKNSPFEADESARAVSADKDNNIWLYASNALHKFDGKEWIKYDSTVVDMGWAQSITGTKGGQVLFSGGKGLFIYDNGKWDKINNTVLKDLPSSRIMYAYKDKQDRLWITSSAGTIMVDKNNKVTKLSDLIVPGNTNTTISAAVEDEAGNLYFSLGSLKNGGNRDNPDEGLGIYTAAGKWAHYNDQNSGLPANTINSLLYDRFEKVLWIGTNDAGLVRYDLKGSWENYHNLNSRVPSSYIFDLSQDSKGNIYASTFGGLMRITIK